MYRLAIVLLIAFFNYSVCAQYTVDDLENSNDYHVGLETLKYSGKALPFKNVVVIDNRFDTSKLGYKKVFKDYERVRTKQSLAESIQLGMNAAIQNEVNTNGKGSLYIFINHLWMQQTTGGELSERKISEGTGNNDTNVVVCNIVLETFILEDDQYFPLIKVDSTIIIPGLLVKRANKLLTLPFQFLLDELAFLDLNRKRKPVDVSVLSSYYAKKYNYPRLHSDAYVKGVYLTYQDFLHNRVTYSSFEVHFGRATDELYIIEDNKKRMLDQFWGFSDGKSHYKKIGFNFFRMRRDNLSYELIGAKVLVQNTLFRKLPGMTMREVVTGGIDLGRSNRTIKTSYNRPLQLNMETGEPY